jgi:excisionase family DNA binding protein
MILPETIPEQDLFKPEAVAELLSIPRRSVYSWVRVGKIGAVKICGSLRITRESLIKLKENKGKGFVNTSKRCVTARIVSGIRSRMRLMLYSKVKAKTTMKLIGCSPEELRAHIEKQFLPGMTWDNYGRDGWSIDHIIPCAQFDLSIPDSQKVCFHYTNLQPLWHIDNIKKGKKHTRRNIRKVIRISHALS